MKCPHCEYMDGYFEDKTIAGYRGEFYSLSNDISMVRYDEGFDRDTLISMPVYGCPSCGKLFIEV